MNLVLDTIRFAMKQVKKKEAEELQLLCLQDVQYASQAYFEVLRRLCQSEETHGTMQ